VAANKECSSGAKAVGFSLGNRVAAPAEVVGGEGKIPEVNIVGLVSRKYRTVENTKNPRAFTAFLFRIGRFAEV
jgi:hypothetical protein